jgi:hypothetical protein
VLYNPNAALKQGTAVFFTENGAEPVLELRSVHEHSLDGMRLKT